MRLKIILLSKKYIGNIEKMNKKITLINDVCYDDCAQKFNATVINPSLKTVIKGVFTLGQYNHTMNLHNIKAHNEYLSCAVKQAMTSLQID